LEELIQRKGGGEALRRAVSKMLPKNSLRKSRLARLKTVEGSENPYAGNITAFWDDAVAASEANMNAKAQELLKTPKE
jgi:large subunit ribosomal protein L13